MKLSGINHLAFITDDMEKTIRFYRDLLRLPLVAGVGHDGFRHYFFQLADGHSHIAFFEYDGASPMTYKFPGERTTAPIGFDHVSLSIESKEALFDLKDRLIVARFPVHGAVDHGMFWSIYFKDPNNIPLEATWQFMEVEQAPAMAEDDPLDIVAEGPDPQPGHWPAVARPTPPDEMVAHAGNAYRMRQEFLESGVARFSDEFEERTSDVDAAE